MDSPNDNSSVPFDTGSLLECAVEAARAAGTHALDNWNRRTEAVKVSQHDIKLKLDQESQVKAEGVISAAFPEHSILGEEDTGARESADSGITWIIDPIDGTVNFSHGLPLWCSSVAASVDGRTIAGAVYAPAMSELYTATSDGHAQCNGSLIHVSEVDTVAKAIITTGIDHNDEVNLEPLEIFHAIAEDSQKTRVWGSAAIDLCNVACGRADGYFEIGIYIWDVAAAGLIVEKAGGRTKLLREFPNGRLSYIAANPGLFTELSGIVCPFVDRA